MDTKRIWDADRWHIAKQAFNRRKGRNLYSMGISISSIPSRLSQA